LSHFSDEEGEKMNSIEIFEKHAQEYDKWFDKNRFVYESEILALRNLVPKEGKGLEVGAGTGRFAVPLGVKVGVEPAKAMANIARKRGIEVYEAAAEELPFNRASFDFVLLVTTICFLQNPVQALQEAKRVLKSGGCIIIGMIDKESLLGKTYEQKKRNSKFYRYANFYSVDQVLEWLKLLNFGNVMTCQTVFNGTEKITSIEPVKDGHGEGGFAVISAKKESDK